MLVILINYELRINQFFYTVWLYENGGQEVENHTKRIVIATLRLLHNKYNSITSKYGRTVLLLLCLMVPLVFLSACTQNGDVDVEETTKSTEEVKPLSSKEKAYEEESIRIAKYSDHVRRDGDTLYLMLDFVSEITFKNLTECDRYETCWYGYFQEYLPDLDLYLIKAQLYEGGYYMIISGSSGKKYRMYDYPEVAPDRLRLVVASSDGEAYGENSIRLWRIEDGELIEEYYFNPTGFSMNYFVKWQDNDTALIKRYVLNSDSTPCQESKVFEAHFALRHKGETWKLDEEPIKGTVNCNPDN
jgi:hypothetical protein